MDTFNRTLAVAVALALLTFASIVLVVAADLAAPVHVMPEGWLQDQLQDLDELGGARKATSVGSAIGATLTAAVLLIIESLPLWRRGRLYGADVKGNKFAVGRESIKLLIEGAAREIGGVTRVSSSFRATPDGLVINCSASLDPSASMPELGSALEVKVKEAVETMAGVPVSGVQLKLRYGAPGRQRGPQVQ